MKGCDFPCSGMVLGQQFCAGGDSQAFCVESNNSIQQSSGNDAQGRGGKDWPYIFVESGCSSSPENRIPISVLH